MSWFSNIFATSKAPSGGGGHWEAKSAVPSGGGGHWEAKSSITSSSGGSKQLGNMFGSSSGGDRGAYMQHTPAPSRGAHLGRGR